MSAILLYLASNPHKLVLFTIAFSPIISLFWSIRIMGFSLVDIFYGAVALLLIGWIIRRANLGLWHKGRFFNAYIVFLSSVIIFMLLNMMRHNFVGGIQDAVKLIIGFISYQIFLNFFRYKGRWSLLLSVYAAIFFTLGLVGVQLATGYGTEHSRFSYLTGLYSNEGVLTRMAVIGLIMSLPYKGNLLVLKYPISSKVVIIASIASLGLSISRGALLAAIVVSLLFLIIHKRLIIFVLIVFIGVLLYSSVGVIRSGYENKMKKEVSFLRGEKINPIVLGSGRIGRWTRTWDSFLEANIATKLFGEGRGTGPHGQFFDLLRRTGIFGILVTLLLYLRLTVFAIKHLNRDKTDCIAFYCVLLLAAFWSLCLAATPLVEIYLQILIFAFIAMLENKDRFLKAKKMLKNNAISPESIFLDLKIL